MDHTLWILHFYTDAGDLIDKPNDEVIKKFVDITEIEERRYIDEDKMNSDSRLRGSKKKFMTLV